MSDSPLRLQPIFAREAIEARSMAIIEAEAPEPRPFAGEAWEVVRRMIHACADFELLRLVRMHPLAIEAGVQALLRGCYVFTDTEMARSGISPRRLDPMHCRAVCLLADERAPVLARQRGLTRSAAAMALAAVLPDLDAALAGPCFGGEQPGSPQEPGPVGADADDWPGLPAHGRAECLFPDLGPGFAGFGGAIVAIGNAPTSLLALLECLRAGADPPALIIGMPVGFVNAAESKELLLTTRSVPFITVRGRKGGSALAAATVNALAELALRRLAVASRASGG